MLKNQWSKKEIEDSEYEIHHRALSEEYSFFEAVKDGNIEAVSKNLKEEAFTNPEGMGILSKNPLTNLKYHFVVTVALVTRYCIDGGMETEQAYRLSDFYIIHMDACSTIQEISDLHHEMTSLEKCAFCRRMPHYPNRLHSALIISMPTSVQESPWKILRSTPICLPAICPGCLSRTSVCRSVIISAKKKSKKRRIFCAFPILPTFRLQTIYHFLPRVILSRHSSTLSV